MKTSRLLLVLALSLPGLLAQTPPPAAPAAPAAAAAPAAPAGPVVDASAAIPKTGPGGASFLQKHEKFLARGKEGPIGVLFLGDSITEGWTKAPHIWEHYYAKYQPANFGIGGDQTQHVVWRIENGELKGITPKVVVLMLGTNNTGLHTGQQIAAADKKIVEMIREKIPGTKVLLLAIFPRGPRKNREGVVTYDAILDAQKRMAAIAAANAELAKLDDGTNVRFLDINARFMGNDGTIPYVLMPDQLHPNAAGYQLWAEAMQSRLDEMMK
ncbi:MAG TPA: GDSL-type esterase/lipase family protein [Lacunisphaera sp.]|nr:GDSL-type esterase/lipase family protein [Lacunisphaera sp.]